MKNILKLSCLGLITASLIACSKEDAKEVANNVAENPELNGKFQSECFGSDVLDFSYRETLEFAGNQFSQIRNYYSTDTCSNESLVGNLSVNGDFVIDADGLPDHPAGSIEIQFDEAEITPQSEDLASALSSVELCGIENFESGVTSEVPKKSSDNWTCPIRDFSSTVYGSYQLEGDELRLNKGGLEAMSTEVDERPKELGKASVYLRN